MTDRPDPGPGDRGLTASEVAERIRGGRVNEVPRAPTRTFGEIVRANLLTPVNAIIGSLLAVILVAYPGPDALFAGVVVSNTIIGIVQELRARRALESLAVLNVIRARVVRDGRVEEIPYEQVVADDVIELQPGDQVGVDGEVLRAASLEVNEALLTGESEPVVKSPGDDVLSGSFVAAGTGRMRATRIGAAAYASGLAEEARRFQLVDSELRAGVNVVLRWLTWIIPPLAVLLAIVLLGFGESWREALRGTVAASVAMVPDGLVLLTSIAFIVGILELARRRALARELASVELLARVDVLCLDKTGTITTGEIAFSGLMPVGGASADEAEDALAALAAADPNPNATLAAIGARFRPSLGWRPVRTVPFSSARRWSSATFEGRGTYILGAPEALGVDGEVRERVATEAAVGRRIVLLARSSDAPAGGDLPPARTPVALVSLEDEVRPDGAEILAFFAAQGVALKVISGDHPATVAAVARRAGLAGAGDGIDARELPAGEDALADVVEDNAVFGRVTPHHKQAMIAALKSRGHTVAMTGDGVNDVLALKDADMGIAMGDGSDATRAVAELVLLDNRFATLPVVLAAGRRVINNIERVANLFVAKATYAVLLTALTIAFTVDFPFVPRQLTLVGTFSIGVPGFFLAMAPNARRAEPGFIHRVLRFSIPAGLVAGVLTFGVYEWLRRDPGYTLAEARSAATLVLLGIGLVILARLARPINRWKALLVAGMFGGYLAVLYLPPLRRFFLLETPSLEIWLAVVGVVAAAAAILHFGPRLIRWWGEGDRLQALPPVERPP
ncbi:MAG TPA: HAD-IC family P-type ATPase [Solirubrobacterales bacterium]|nr:HAD-IC family P-type ATPase [Solirubrobacterales bacterium]